MFMAVLALAFAAGEPSPGFLICSSQDSSSGRTVVYVGEPIHGSDDDIPKFKTAFVDEVQQQYGVRLPYSGCATAYTRKEAKDGFDYATDYARRREAEVVILKWTGARGNDWSSSSIEAARARPNATLPSVSPNLPSGKQAIAAPSSRPKLSNAEADAVFAAKKAEYDRAIAAQQADYQQALEAVARKKQEQRLASERAAADYRRQLEAHAQAVRSQQLEYQKQVAKPSDATNAVYRGFWARDCEAARRSATMGAGTSTTTRFIEVTNEVSNSGCTVQGWWWNVAGGGTATRQ